MHLANKSWRREGKEMKPFKHLWQGHEKHILQNHPAKANKRHHVGGVLPAPGGSPGFLLPSPPSPPACTGYQSGLPSLRSSYLPLWRLSLWPRSRSPQFFPPASASSAAALWLQLHPATHSHRRLECLRPSTAAAPQGCERQTPAPSPTRISKAPKQEGCSAGQSIVGAGLWPSLRGYSALWRSRALLYHLPWHSTVLMYSIKSVCGSSNWLSSDQEIEVRERHGCKLPFTTSCFLPLVQEFLVIDDPWWNFVKIPIQPTLPVWLPSYTTECRAVKGCSAIPAM